jgi:hypothetical protein
MMKRIVMPVPFEDRTVSIRYTDDFEKMNGKFSPVTTEFIKNGYVVLRNFIPKEIIDMTLDAWKVIERDPSHNEHFFHTEKDITDNSPKDSLFKSQGSYNFPPSIALHRWMRDNLDKVFDFKLVETYSFTRKYDRGAYLRAHTDRPSCEISTTICLDYKSDDNTPWKIWVQKDKNWVDEGADIELLGSVSQELPHRDRVGTPISLEVGDVLLYQGPNAIHWRDRFLGEYSYHMFLHFINGIGRTVDMPNAKGKVDRGVDPRNAGVFSYDGRPNRYAPESEKSVQFEKAMDAWNNWDEKKYGKKSDYLNNYSHITVVEEKKKK